MPKKRNFLGGMQNYDPKTGEYEPDLKGPDGEKPSSFKNFKKDKSQHDKINDKRMGVETQISDNVARKEMKMLRDGIIEKEQLDELKETFKGKDYEEALRQVDEGRPFGEVLSGLVRYEEYDEDYERSWGPADDDEDEEDKSQFEKINKKRMNKGLGYDPRNREESTREHNRRIKEINDKYGRNKMTKEEYHDALDLEDDRWNNEQDYWYEHEDTPYDKENAKRQAEKYKHGGIAGELEGLDFTMDKVDEENQTLEFKGKRGNYKIVQSKDNPANYETYLNDELVMKGQGSAYIAGNIKKYDNDDDFVERVKAKNKELDNAKDKSFDNINKKRMGNDNLPF